MEATFSVVKFMDLANPLRRAFMSSAASFSPTVLTGGGAGPGFRLLIAVVGMKWPITSFSGKRGGCEPSLMSFMCCLKPGEALMALVDSIKAFWRLFSV